MQKKKPALSPQAAKILEQYRNAVPKKPDGTGGAADNAASGEQTTGPKAPGAQMRRSGSRGK
jgi:hypothetical protein